MSPYIFEEYQGRSGGGDNISDEGPEVARVFFRKTFPGVAEWLARIGGNETMKSSTED
jgi:hypothetical protein